MNIVFQIWQYDVTVEYFSVQLKESAAVLINMIDNVMDVLTNNQKTNAPVIDIVTPDAYLKVAKVSPDKIDGNTFNAGMTYGVSFPTNMDLTNVSRGSISLQV